MSDNSSASDTKDAPASPSRTPNTHPTQLATKSSDTLPIADSGSATVDNQQTAATMSSELLSNLITYLKACAVLLLVWLIGWFNFSFAWILLFVTLYLLRDQVQHQRLLRLSVKRSIALDEQAVIKAAVEHLPSWVHFPDRERAEWINKVCRVATNTVRATVRCLK